MSLKNTILTAFLLAALGASASAANSDRILEIKVKSRGMPIPDPDFVLAYVGARQGDVFTPRIARRDIKSIMESGRFSYVDSEIQKTPEGIILTYVVEMKPRLAGPVSVRGAESASISRIREWLGLETGDFIDDATLSVKVAKVKFEYAKRYYPDCKVTWDITVNDATGAASVQINIVEGKKTKVRRILFSGNQSVKDDELREMVKEQIWKPVISQIISLWIPTQGIYDPATAEANRALLRRVCQNKGYLDAEIGQPEVLLETVHKLALTYPVNEGRMYRIGDISVQGATLFEETELLRQTQIKTGDIAALSAIERDARAIADYYQSRGYIRTAATPVFSPGADESFVNLIFKIAESELVHLRYVEITGNTKTKDEVIRREIIVYPGEIYDQVRVRRSERILRNLGLFSSVTAFPMETDDRNRDDVVFEVEESRTGQFMIGAGYSSIDEIVGFAELSQGNFDIFGWPNFTGAGQKLRLRAQIGTQRSDYSISFVEPWFLGRKLSLGLDLYHNEYRYLSTMYNLRQTGGAVTLGKPIPGFFQRVELKYSANRYNVYDVSTNATAQIKNEEGVRTESGLRLTFIHDTRDNFFIPTSGKRITLSGRVSGGPLGMDTKVYGFEGRGSIYWRLWWRHVLSLRAWAEVVEEYGGDPDVHLPDRLYLGGANTLRGFKYRYVGPTDAATGEPLGGKTGYMGSAEYTVPIVQWLRLAGFYDIGYVWPDAYQVRIDEYCTDIGVGARIDIPGFPIRLDYAWPLEATEEVYRTKPRFNFSMGYSY